MMMGLLAGAAAMGSIAQTAPGLSTAELAGQLGRLERRFEERLGKLEAENALLRTQVRILPNVR